MNDNEAAGGAATQKGGINLRARLRNPVFWVQLALAAALPVGAYFGITAQEVTSWPALWGILCDAARNPYVLALVAASVWNALNDPTTKGLSDSTRALGYQKPV